MLVGTLAVRAAGSTLDAVPGAMVAIPRGVPHTFANPSGAPARGLVLCTPAGHERFFDALAGAIVAAGGLPEPATLAALNAAHGIIAAAPPSG